MYSVYTFAVWLFVLWAQLMCNKLQKKYKAQDALLTDQRMKLVNDLVSGIRTIKAYAWENHYLRKIQEIRAKQHSVVFKFNVSCSIGYAVLSNSGFIVILLILVPQWQAGKYISSESAFSMMAMIFYLFYSCTSLFLWAVSTLSQVAVLLGRLADVFKMEEHKKLYSTNLEAKKGVKVEDGSFTWGFKVKENQSQTVQKLTLEKVESPTLQGINIDLKMGQLLLVAGKIGCGKTTLLHGLMEEN